MTDNTHPEALRLADWLQAAVQIFPQRSEDEPGGYASEVDQIMDEAAAELRRQHARIADLEAQLSSSGFTAADMATAESRGFRDGVASVAASAGSEPVAWRYVDARGHFRYVGYKPSRDMAAEYPLLKPIRLYLHPSPPEGMVGGWMPIATAPVAGLILLAVEDSAGERRVFAAEASHENGGWVWNVILGWLGWMRLHSGWTPILWRRLPPPPTTSAGSGKGE